MRTYSVQSETGINLGTVEGVNFWQALLAFERKSLPFRADLGSHLLFRLVHFKVSASYLRKNTIVDCSSPEVLGDAWRRKYPTHADAERVRQELQASVERSGLDETTAYAVIEELDEREPMDLDAAFREPELNVANIIERAKAEAYYLFFAGPDPSEDWCEPNLAAAGIRTLLSGGIEAFKQAGFQLSEDEIAQMCDAFRDEIRVLRSRWDALVQG